jgi:hypothetical protein
MSRVHEVKVYTTPAAFTAAFQPRLPLQRIIGVSGPDGDLWADMPDTLGKGWYDPTQAKETAIALEDGMRHRLPELFEKHFVPPLTEQPSYNCHSFALALRGISLSITDATDLAGNLIQHQPRPTDVLNVGQLGIIGGKPTAYHRRKAEHSVIGLGRNSELCLSVLGDFGILAIAHCQDMLEEYRPGYAVSPEDADMEFELFAINAAELREVEA